MNRRVIRVNPLREMVDMQNALERLFEDTCRSAYRSGNGDPDYSYRLPVDVIETEQGYLVAAELPGAHMDNITVQLEDETLYIEGEIPTHDIDDEKARTLLNERRAGKFTRTLRLPAPVDGDNVEAVFENGLLTLSLPKTPAVQPKRISIKQSTEAIEPGNN
ncbi:MAG: Hsp20/alpha crystallin family protein [Chloroflexi bacterium]|nr:Hsp20/alpha crystallin family protein [Chloroflexota bacterium]